MCWFYKIPKFGLHVKGSIWRGNQIGKGVKLNKRIIFSFCSINDLEIFKLSWDILQRIVGTKRVLNGTSKIYQKENVCRNGQIIF